MGRGRVIGEALVNHPGVAAISFTGSVGVGRGIAAACVASGKKVQLEMGGKNPQVVLDDADLKQAVELSAQSCFYSTGQRCTASSRIIVTDKIYPAFVEALKVRIEAIKVGAALATGTDMGPVVVVMTSSVRRCHLPDSSLFRTVARVTFSSVSWRWESAPACTAASSGRSAPGTFSASHNCSRACASSTVSRCRQ